MSPLGITLALIGILLYVVITIKIIKTPHQEPLDEAEDPR